MQTPIEWLLDHIPNRVNEDGVQVLRWTSDQGHEQEAPVTFVVDKFGAAIADALSSGTDVIHAVLASSFDAGWHDIWRRWRELGYI